jgi:glutamyl-tRNA reductase
MEVKIYCIQDCDGLKYVGSTRQKLKYRLNNHRRHKKINHGCSSEKLNLENCSITELEKCNEENRMEREKYWINKLNTVNERKLNFDKKQYQKEYHKEYDKEYHENNKEKRKQQMKIWHEKNKEKRKQYQKEYRENKYIEKVVKNCLDDLITKIEIENLK